jgi:hypothetical protein
MMHVWVADAKASLNMRAGSACTRAAFDARIRSMLQTPGPTTAK